MKRDDLPASVLERRAIVYVRQSTMIQVEGNLESQRRQYELADRARELGFHDIVVIDDVVACQPAARAYAPASSRSSRRSAKALSAACFVWRPPGSHVTGAIGTICSSCADSSVRAYLTSTASTIPVFPTIGCCLGSKAQ